MRPNARLILRLSEYSLSAFCVTVWAYLLVQGISVPVELATALGAGFALGVRRPSDYVAKGNVTKEEETPPCRTK